MILARKLYVAFLISGLVGLATVACASPPETPSISLVDIFQASAVENPQAPEAPPARTEWDFGAPEGLPTVFAGGWRAVHGVTGLALRDGRLTGRADEPALIAAAVPPGLDPEDLLHAVAIRLKISRGTRLGVSFDSSEELDEEDLITGARESLLSDLNMDLVPGPEPRTYTLTGSASSFSPSFPLSRIRHVIIRLVGAEGTEFEIDSVDLISRGEHLASIPSGIGWHGLGEIYRETLVSRSPERISFALDLPSEPYLDLALGLVEDAPVTFRVEVGAGGPGAPQEEILRRTVSTPRRWETVTAGLEEFAGRKVTLTLSLESEGEGAIGFWGSPVVRNRAGEPRTVEAGPALKALAGEEAPPPQGVIVILTDTIRRDHLGFYGYERDTAPVLARLASEGVLFRDAIAQGTWTKVSAPSILTSLFPSTHGIKDTPDRLAASVTTLAEAYRQAGYATFATSSVPFTGKLTNLHQGVEVLHERASITDEELPRNSRSKTARIFVDRLLDWIEGHRDVPFYARLHVFDPHSPYQPYRPYDTLWLTQEEVAEHQEAMETVKAFIKDEFMINQGVLPTREEIDASGIDMDTFMSRHKAWYDASIRSMDVEVGRLLQRLKELGLDGKTLIAFVGDHGEEFLEHGQVFHGHQAYGEMLNMPMLVWWPGVVPPGVEVEDTVLTIDLMPTLLGLSRLPGPEAMQGQSLLPLVVPRDSPAARDWRPRPAFAEKAIAPSDTRMSSRSKEERDSLVIIRDGWKLIQNADRPEGWPEFELFNHREDPLNLANLAETYPDKVEDLATRLASWHESALAARVDPAAGTEELSAEELNRLRSLGYVD